MLKRLATLLCCLPLMVSAAQVTDLYQGKAPTSGDMTAAQSQALGDVLVKVTGRRDILTQPEVAKALAAPGDYVQHYGYQDVGPVKFLKADFKPSTRRRWPIWTGSSNSSSDRPVRPCSPARRIAGAAARSPISRPTRLSPSVSSATRPTTGWTSRG